MSVKKKIDMSRLDLRCPPLPSTLLEALRLIENPEMIAVKPVSMLVKRDPFVVSRMFQVVNSAYYGVRTAITSIERATVMLGPIAVAGLVVSMNMLKMKAIFRAGNEDVFLRLIRHNLATAHLTKLIVNGMPEPGDDGPSEALGIGFSAGLLHDFGKMILMYNFPEKAASYYGSNVKQMATISSNKLDREEAYFGYDHVEAGVFVAKKLGLPAQLIEVIQHHHTPEKVEGKDSQKRLVYATAIASEVAKCFGYDFEQSLSKEQCLEDARWEPLAELSERQFPNKETMITYIWDYEEKLKLAIEA